MALTRSNTSAIEKLARILKVKPALHQKSLLHQTRTFAPKVPVITKVGGTHKRYPAAPAG